MQSPLKDAWTISTDASSKVRDIGMQLNGYSLLDTRAEVNIWNPEIVVDLMAFTRC